MSSTSQRIAALSPEERRALLAQLLRKQADGSPPVHPISYGQRALWFLHQLAPESPAYNLMLALQVRSRLDTSALEHALQALVDRHDSLRATYTIRDGQPVQQIPTQQAVPFAVVDASAWNQEHLGRRLIEEAHRPFDLEHDPPLRVDLFVRGEQDAILLLVIHHITADLWSLTIFVDELRTLYIAELQGSQAALPPLQIHYTDYVRWQSAMLAGPEGDRLWAYWRHQLRGPLPVLNLPTDRLRPRIQTYRGNTHAFRLDTALSQGLRALAQARQTTLYTVLLAAFQMLLHRYTQQADLLIGTYMAGRSQAAFEPIVGYFTNPVVMRADASGNPPFTAFLDQTRRAVLDALDHQAFPFSQLVERLMSRRDPSRSPLVDIIFVLQRPHLAFERLLASEQAGPPDAQLHLEPFPLEQQIARFDMEWELIAGSDTLSGSIQYNTDLFDQATIARMARHYQSLLAGIVADPQQRLADIPLLTRAERHDMLVTWNTIQRADTSEACLHTLFETQAEQTPDRVALSDGEHQVTYQALNTRADHLAHHLRGLGVGPEVRVGIYMDRSIGAVVGIVGVLKAGGAYVPLDPAYPVERLAFMISDAQMQILLAGPGLRGQLPSHTAQTIELDQIWSAAGRDTAPRLPSQTVAANAAYVIYTSGSTGRPKGVLGPHHSAVNRLRWMWATYPFAAAEVCCQRTALSFIDSIWELFGPLLQGVRTVIIPDMVLRDPEQLIQFLADQHVSRIVLVPSLLRLLLDSVPELQARLPALHYWVSSGETLSAKLAERFLEHMSQRRLINLYGSSEVAADATAYDLCRWEAGSNPPIGQPIANTQVYLLDRQLQLVPIGVPGELYIGGAGLAHGYLNLPALTAERFVPNPFARIEGRGWKIEDSQTHDGTQLSSILHPPSSSGARLYRTGDLARYRPDGNIEYLGRADQQVKVRGVRVELGEIEAVLLQHPQLQECAVLATEGASGDLRLVAYIVQAIEGRGSKIDASHAGAHEQLSATLDPLSSDLRAFLRQRLPDVMVPAVFVPLDALPRTPNGKIDRRALPAPGAERPALLASYIAPSTALEREIAAVWQDLLEIQQVGIADNFFDLGGHSLLLVQIQRQLCERLAQEVPMVDLFRYPTVGALAQYLDTAQHAQSTLQDGRARAAIRKQLLSQQRSARRAPLDHDLRSSPESQDR